MRSVKQRNRYKYCLHLIHTIESTNIKIGCASARFLQLKITIVQYSTILCNAFANTHKGHPGNNSGVSFGFSLEMVHGVFIAILCRIVYDY